MLDNFLAKEEWRKYQLLKKVERSPYFALTKKELSDDLEMSNYVLKVRSINWFLIWSDLAWRRRSTFL
ncbi:MAG: hypothetical protein ACTJG1_11190 [Enterococcus gilvus]